MTGAEEVQGLLENQRRLQPVRAVAYSCIGISGLILMYDPTQSLAQEQALIRWVWGTFLVTGALIAVIGTLTNKWLVEWPGLPLIASALLGLVWILIARANTGALAFAALLMALTLLLGGRFWGLWLLNRATSRARLRRHRE